MKLVYPEIKQVINLSSDRMNSLVIENPPLLYRFVTDLQSQVEKMAGSAILSENDEILPIAKNVIFLTSIFDLNISSKTILTKLYGELEERANSPEMYERSMKLMADIQNYIQELTWDVNCDIACEDILPKQIIKAAGPVVESRAESPEEKIFEYVRVMEHFLGEKLFVFLNFRGFLNEEQFLLLAETLTEHGITTLFIDNVEYPRIDKEQRLVIDADLCEI